MKVNHSSAGWHNVTKKMGEYLVNVAARKSPQGRVSGADYPNQFSSKTDVQRKRALTSESAPFSINMLERFIEVTSSRCISFRGLISSHLQPEIDVRSDKEIKNALAIQRMLMVVNTTIAEMRAIELNQISYNKA